MSGCNGICLALLVHSMSIVCLLSHVTNIFFTECMVIIKLQKNISSKDCQSTRHIFCFFIIYALPKLHMQYRSFPDTIANNIFTNNAEISTQPNKGDENLRMLKPHYNQRGVCV